MGRKTGREHADPTRAGPEAVAAVTDDPRIVALRDGGSVEVLGGRHVVVRAGSGDVLLDLEVTERGSRIRLSALSLELAAEEDIQIACRHLEVRTRGDLRRKVLGSVRELVRGDVRSVADGERELVADTTTVESTRGNVELIANDDVRAKGERIRLNC